MAIIALAGRKQYGKSEIASRLISKYEFIQVNFADKLKNVISKLCDFTIESLSDPIIKEQGLNVPFVWNQENAKRLANILEMDKDLWALYPKLELLHTRRRILQFIGTDILRSKIDPNFHVNEFIKQIKSEGNFVCQDVRFLNEVSMLEKLNAQLIFIVRPLYFSVSNHTSEIELRRNQFKYIIVNTGSLEEHVKKIDRFFESKGDNLIQEAKNNDFNNDGAFLNICSLSSYWAGFLRKYGEVSNSHSEIKVSHEDKKKVELFRNYIDGGTSVVYADGKFEMRIFSPFLVDDLKIWDIDPKNKYSVPPFVLTEYHQQYLEDWKRGYND